MRIVYNGQVQEMTVPGGNPKEMKMVLKERVCTRSLKNVMVFKSTERNGANVKGILTLQ